MHNKYTWMCVCKVVLAYIIKLYLSHIIDRYVARLCQYQTMQTHDSSIWKEIRALSTDQVSVCMYIYLLVQSRAKRCPSRKI